MSTVLLKIIDNLSGGHAPRYRGRDRAFGLYSSLRRPFSVKMGRLLWDTASIPARGVTVLKSIIFNYEYSFSMKRLHFNAISFRTFLLLSCLSLATSLHAQQALPGDIIINEFMADPTPVIGLPEREFVEIFNRSTKNINLSGWTIKDGSTTKGTISSVNIAPGEYAIICRIADTSLFSPFGKLAAASTLPSINNDADSLVLADATGRVIDKIYFTDAWYRDAARKDGGYTIERINPEDDCAGDLNWRASLSIQGGTPGTVNSVFGVTPDNTAPLLATYSLSGDSLLKISFNENMDTLLLKNPAAYQFTPALNVSSIVIPDPKSVNIKFSSPISEGILYTVRIQGLADCPGNNLVDTSVSFGLAEIPSFNEILITEIMADPSPVVGLPDAEYIEIYNNSDKILSLGGIRLKDGTGTATFQDQFLLPRQYRIVTSESNAPLFANFGGAIALKSFPSLTNSGEELVLIDAFDVPIFYVEYTDTWYTNSLKRNGGWSLELIDISKPCLGTGNWTDSKGTLGGTPGAANSVAGTVEISQIPQATYVEVISKDTLVVNFDKPIYPSSIFSSAFFISPSVNIVNLFVINNAFTKVELVLETSLQPNTIYPLYVKNIEDCQGNKMIPDTLYFGLPDSVVQGDIIINEILFNPKTNGADFVEILNVSNKILAIKDLIIAEEDAVSGDYSESANLLSSGRQILPGQYLALTSKADAVMQFYTTPGKGAFIETSSMPNYNDDEGIAVLLTKNLQVLDRFAYLDDYHFQLLDDEDGVSLERISSTQATQDPKNWQSAAKLAGFATPGYRNSVYLVPNISGKLNLSPEVFSPDQDGFDDVLGINYQFEKPAYIGTVGVYTVEGIPVRKLVKNETLLQEGLITWDGLDDEGKKARTGIYVVLFEVFDLEGNKDVLRAKCVLATKLN